MPVQEYCNDSDNNYNIDTDPDTENINNTNISFDLSSQFCNNSSCPDNLNQNAKHTSQMHIQQNHINNYNNYSIDTVSDTENVNNINNNSIVICDIASQFNSDNDFPDNLKQNAEHVKGAEKHNRRNFCMFCQSLQTNISRHMIRHHRSEYEVIEYQKILDPDLKERGKKRRRAIMKLIRKGNFIYNRSVAQGEINGTYLPCRNEKNKIASPSGYVTCRYCFGFFKRLYLSQHLERCKSDIAKSSRNLKNGSLLLNARVRGASQDLKDKVFPIFKNDHVSNLAMADDLICSFGSNLLSSHKEVHHKTYVSQKMRDLAKLLTILRELDPEISKLSDCFNPTKFDVFIQAVHKMSGYDEDTGVVKVPSIAPRLGTTIKTCAELYFCQVATSDFCSETRRNYITGNIDKFKRILESQWKYKISSNAEKSRKFAKINKGHVMPLDDDIKIVTDFLLTQEIVLYENLKTDSSAYNYEQLCFVVIADIIIFNRRREGEVVRAKLSHYVSCATNKDILPEAVVGTLSDPEKQALNYLTCFYIPGKRGRTVPVLLTKNMRKIIDLLVDYRHKVCIPEDNPWLFPRPNNDGPYDGCKIFRHFREMLNLKNPSHFTSSGLRHHVATMSQVEGTDENFRDFLATFLGHDILTHRSNYQLPQKVIQVGKIGHHLLKLNKRQNACNLPDNTINDKEPKVEKHFEDTVNTYSSSDNDLDLDEDYTLPENESNSFKRKKVISRTRWTEIERRALFKHFSKSIESKKNPGKARCSEVVRRDEVLRGKTWQQVSTMVNNYLTGKLLLPSYFNEFI